YSGLVFPGLVGMSQAVGVAIVVVTGVWLGHHHGGFAWDGSAHQFNVHPLCMVLGMVVLYGDGEARLSDFLSVPTPVCPNLKILHGSIHLLALLVSIIGLVAVFNFHRVSGIPDLYSLHSWCGVLTVTLFLVQWLMGLGFFLFPGASSWLREWYLPLHAFFGLFLLAVSIATCLTGITEKLLFSIMETYSLRAPEGLLANSLALLLLLFGGLVGFIVTREEFRRPPQPEEEALSVHFTSLTPSSP
uniref:Transmembrane ascorbate-dependent reductase CYB561 n=1 Tax=Gadus morhua TaxID=8049 RepID=A0A8C5A1R8_GADMO